MPSLRPEHGQVAPAVVAVVCVLALAAAALTGLARASLAQARAGSAADAAALAGARVLLERSGDLLPRHDPRARRTLPPLLTRAALDRLVADAARASAAEHGAAVVAVRVEPVLAGALPTSLDVTVRLRRDRLPSWLGAGGRRMLATARARAGAEPEAAVAVAGRAATGRAGRLRRRRRGGGGRRGAARLALRLGRREPGRGRLRLLGARRLRARGGRVRQRAADGRGASSVSSGRCRSTRPCSDRATSCSSAGRRTTSASTRAAGS